jgi:hypothetical protein
MGDEGVCSSSGFDRKGAKSAKKRGRFRELWREVLGEGGAWARRVIWWCGMVTVIDGPPLIEPESILTGAERKSKRKERKRGSVVRHLARVRWVGVAY